MEAAKEAVEILEDDDDFEEFEIENTGVHDMIDNENIKQDLVETAAYLVI